MKHITRLKNFTKSNGFRFEAAAIMALTLALAFSVTSFAGVCAQVRGSVLRMHVIANSDSPEDQSLKLKVRDAVLEEGADIFDGSLTAADAEEKISLSKERLTLAAEKVIEENGFDYDVNIDVVYEYFSTRSYGSITLPAGKYTAVKVMIGEAQGKNWWCVMFPPLCLPAAVQTDDAADAFLSEDGSRVVHSEPKFEPRFKIVELWEKLSARFGI
ncbi:MAG: stage II sporulation protein R [Clostridiales bacterium]|nr:stage II sporulation protein R [Clostridiales bacterium]